MAGFLSIRVVQSRRRIPQSKDPAEAGPSAGVQPGGPGPLQRVVRRLAGKGRWARSPSHQGQRSGGRIALLAT